MAFKDIHEVEQSPLNFPCEGPDVGPRARCKSRCGQASGNGFIRGVQLGPK